MNEYANISTVERDTGLSKDTLRVWERRYGFPTPLRDDNGDRIYPADQVEKLRLIRRLLDQGKRPAKIVNSSLEQLSALLEETGEKATETMTPEVSEAAFLELICMHRSRELRTLLQQLMLKHGLQKFACDIVPVLSFMVGQAWVRGELDVSEEHLYSELMQNVLRTAIGSHGGSGGRPRILLTTFPDELHSIGLLMAEAVLVPEGASCISLGIQTPLGDLTNAATAGQFDVVALSFSTAFPVRQAVDGLNQLRRMLPSAIEIWAGGALLGSKRSQLEGVEVVDNLRHALEQLARWRAAHLN